MSYVWTRLKGQKLKKYLADHFKFCCCVLGMGFHRTHDLFDAGAVLYQLSYQANWELALL